MARRSLLSWLEHLARSRRCVGCCAGVVVAAVGLLALVAPTASAASLSPAPPPSDPRQIEPSFWRERIFFIPFQPDPQQFLSGSTRVVRLLMSRDGVTWQTLQEARPEVRGFSYHAPSDGQYFFAVQVEDDRGALSPATIDAPQLRVVVDSSKPTLSLQAMPAPAGATMVRYDVRDLQLAMDSLRIEVREGDGPWRSVQVGPADVARGDRLMGRVTWAPTTSGGAVAFRATVSDHAGNVATAETSAGHDSTRREPTSTNATQQAVEPSPNPGATGPSLIPRPMEGPALQGPTFDGPSLGPAAADDSGQSFGATPLLPNDRYPTYPLASDRSAQDWPASNSLPSSSRTDVLDAAGGQPAGSAHQHAALSSADRPTPPVNNPYAPAGANRPEPSWDRTPSWNDAGTNNAHASRSSLGNRTVFSDDPFSSDDRTTVGEAASRPLTAPAMLPAGPLNPFANASTAAPALDTGDAPSSSEHGNWAGNSRGPHGDLPPGAMMVNTRTFDVDYDVSTAGDWGVARVELWGTSDNGATWSSFAVDPDSRSPVRVTTPGAGLFGMRIVVHGANAATAPPPAAGARPEMFVYVDLYPPSVTLLGAERGEGDAADQLRIRWNASDAYLADRPVTILYSSYESGPWSTAAANLPNTGEFCWRLQRHLPERLYLRVEVTDQAGNVGAAVSQQPVHLQAPPPVGRLRGVRPTEPATPAFSSPLGR